MPMKGLFENMISLWDCLLGHHKVGLAIFCVLEKEGEGRICSVYLLLYHAEIGPHILLCLFFYSLFVFYCRNKMPHNTTSKEWYSVTVWLFPAVEV